MDFNRQIRAGLFAFAYVLEKELRVFAVQFLA